MKSKLFAAWLAAWMAATAAAQPPLLECHPRGGLPNFHARLRHGDQVRVGYLGGSITAQEGWRPQSLNWLRAQYSKAQIDEINAAIGGTGSDLGAFRLQHDVLGRKPDLVLVEFAVNDAGAKPEQIYRGMEGIVRQIWRYDPSIDICFVYTISGPMLQVLQDGKLPSSYAAMERVAEHYGIPSINLGLEVARLEEMGELVFKAAKPTTAEEAAKLGDKILFSPDDVHPYADSGHQLYFDAVVRGLELMKTVGSPSPHQLIGPLVADNWENAKMLPIDRAELSGDWAKLDPASDELARSYADRVPGLWKSNQPGAQIQFKFRGTAAALYAVIGPGCGQVVITLDDNPPVTQPLFDRFCTYYRLSLLNIGSGLPDTIHTVKIEIHPDQPDKAKILGPGKIDDPKRFDDRACYVGALMLVGELAIHQ